MTLEPYLYFNGRCEEAIEFYKKTLGAEVTLFMRAKDTPDPAMCPAGMPGDKVLAAALRIGQNTLRASDGMGVGTSSFQDFSLSLGAADDAEAERLFKALGEGGQVVMPLAPTFFASRFGMLNDRFGVSWMIVVAL